MFRAVWNEENILLKSHSHFVVVFPCFIKGKKEFFAQPTVSYQCCVGKSKSY